jgi:cytochrome c oxidase assembly factor CtaG
MMIHFVLAGYLFANGLVGVDPGPARVAYPLRVLLLFATMAFHAFFGVALTSTDTLLEATYFSSLGLGIDALADQHDGGAIAWGIGEVPTVGLALLVAYQWFRSDEREARRRDRRADRDGDAELDEYNRMLEQMGGR